MKTIKLMADYQCFPLWNASVAEQPGNIDPASLPISAALKGRLAAWAARYDATLDMDDPLASGFADPAEEVKFQRDGAELGRLLLRELGSGYRVDVQV